MSPVVSLPPLAAPTDELWHLLLDMAGTLTVPWTIVGGQMVLLHALEHGQVPIQVSQDGDVVADIRADPAAVSKVVAWLESNGLTVDSMSPQGIAHRYTRAGRADSGVVTVDVLAPEGLGEHADLVTTPPGRTLMVPGGSQALKRTERVVVRHEGRTGAVPRPSLLAAIVSKAAAVTLPGNPERHYRDLALLLSIVPDPFEMREQLSAKDRQRLRAATKLTADDHVAWTLVPADLRSSGQAALQILLDT